MHVKSVRAGYSELLGLGINIYFLDMSQAEADNDIIEISTEEHVLGMDYMNMLYEN